MGSDRSAKRHTALKITLGICAVLILGSLLAFRQPSPVGHWRSAEGHAEFMSHYTQAMRALPEPASIMDIRTQYGIVRVYRFTGESTGIDPLVLLPGRASGSPVWGDNLPTLLEIADVYTIDLIGEPGMSVQTRPIKDDTEQAAWLDQTLAHLPEESFNIVGLSIGGWTAANLALKAPEQIASLTLIDPVFVFDGMPIETILRSIPASLPFLPREWRDSFNSWTAGGARIQEVPVADMIEAGMQHYAIKLPQPARLSQQALAGIEVPMLAILAGESVMHDPAAAITTAERVADTVSVYDNASHAISGEHPEEIAADIADFLAR